MSEHRGTADIQSVICSINRQQWIQSLEFCFFVFPEEMCIACGKRGAHMLGGQRNRPWQRGNSPPNPFSLFHYDELQAGSMAALLGIVFPTSVHLERAV